MGRGGNGCGIVTDGDGNPIVMGTTTENLLRWRSEKNHQRGGTEFAMETLTPEDETKKRRILPSGCIHNVPRTWHRTTPPTHGKSRQHRPDSPPTDTVRHPSPQNDKHKYAISMIIFLVFGFTLSTMVVLSLVGVHVYHTFLSSPMAQGKGYQIYQGLLNRVPEG